MARLIQIPYKPRPVYQEAMHKGMEGHRFSVVVAHRRFGKTVAVINHLIKQACCIDIKRFRAPRYSYVAPLLNQAKAIAWDYLRYYSSPIPGVKVNESELYVQLPNGARIRLFGADHPDRLRGLYFDGVVMDEIAQMKPEVWDEVVRPTLSDRQGWAVFIGTPKGMGLFYELYQRALKDESWYAGLFRADVTGYIPAEELELLRRSMSEAAFRQEFLCDFTADVANSLIPFHLVHEASGKEVHPSQIQHASKVVGVDVARFGDDRTVMIRRQGIAAFKIRKYRGMDTMQVAGLVAQEIKDWKPDAVFVDVVGIGAGVVDRLRQLGHGSVVIPVNMGRPASKPGLYYNLRAECYDRLRDWLAEGGAIPDDPELRQELLNISYEYDARNRIKLERKEDMKERGLSSPDCADALAITFAQVVHPKRWAQRPMFTKHTYNPLQGVPTH